MTAFEALQKYVSEGEEYNELASSISYGIVDIFRFTGARIGTYSPVKGKPFGFLSVMDGSVFIHESTKGFGELQPGELSWATVAKTSKGLRATSCGALTHEKFVELTEKHHVKELIKAEVTKRTIAWKKAEEERKAFLNKLEAERRERDVKIANLVGGYREYISDQTSSYGGRFVAIYNFDRPVSMDEFKEFIQLLGHKAEAKACNNPICKEVVQITPHMNNMEYDYYWRGEWTD